MGAMATRTRRACRSTAPERSARRCPRSRNDDGSGPVLNRARNEAASVRPVDPLSRALSKHTQLEHGAFGVSEKASWAPDLAVPLPSEADSSHSLRPRFQQ